MRNMSEKIHKYLDNVIYVLILFTVFFVPVFFSYYFRIFSTYSFDKNLLFCILAELLLILYLIKIFTAKRIVLGGNMKYFVNVSFLFIVVSVSSLFSIDAQNSFYGSYSRHDGLYSMIHYLIFFLILLANIHDRKKAFRILLAMMLSGLFVSLCGIAQWLGIDPLPYSETNQLPGQRVVSTIGQPMLLGSFLIVAIFLPLWLLFYYQKSKLKILNILAFIAFFLCLAFTYSRGAWLAFFAGTVFLSLFLFIRRYKIFTKKNILSVFICILLMCGAVFLLKWQSFEGPYAFSERIKSMADFNFGSFAIRIRTWNASISAISEKPLLGYGPDSQYQVLSEYYEPTWSIYESINASPDRAHNIILDLLITIGIIGFFAYFILIISTIRGLLRIKAKKDDARQDILPLVLAASLFALHISLLTSFLAVETYLYLWTIIAISVLLISDFELWIIELKSIKKSLKIILACGLVAVLAILFCQIQFNINRYLADYHLRLGKIAYHHDNLPEMYKNYFRAIELSPTEKHYKNFFLVDVMDSLDKIESKQYQQAVVTYLKKIGNPYQIGNNYFNKVYLAKLNSLFGYYDDKKYFQAAENDFLSLNRLNPFIPLTYYDWGKMYMYKGDYRRALTIFNLGLKVLPALDDQVLNNPVHLQHKDELIFFQTKIFYNIAYSYMKLGDYSKAIDYYKMILRENPYWSEVYKFISINYALKKDMKNSHFYEGRYNKLLNLK